MTDVKYRPDEWEKAKNALGELLDSGWLTSGIQDYVKDIHNNIRKTKFYIKKW